jgi:hypothetical protein
MKLKTILITKGDKKWFPFGIQLIPLQEQWFYFDIGKSGLIHVLWISVDW